MRRSLAALWHGLWLNRQQQSLLTITLSLATSLWLWLEGGRVLDVESLQNLWRSTHHPQTLFEHLLAPLAGNPDLAVAIMAVLSTLSLWLYCRLSRLIGIGPQTTFILFLLLNFNPEYNDVRLQISRFQPVLLLWLAGLHIFLAHYKNHIHLCHQAATGGGACVNAAASCWPTTASSRSSSRSSPPGDTLSATGCPNSSPKSTSNAAKSPSSSTPTTPLTSPSPKATSSPSSSSP